MNLVCVCVCVCVYVCAVCMLFVLGCALTLAWLSVCSLKLKMCSKYVATIHVTSGGSLLKSALSSFFVPGLFVAALEDNSRAPVGLELKFREAGSFDG